MIFFSESGFLCVESERRSERVMAVRVGRFSRNPAEACNTQLFFDEAAVRTTTLISKLQYQLNLESDCLVAFKNPNTQCVADPQIL